MISLLLTLDHQLFLFINHLPHGPLADGIALGLSGLGMGGLIWIVISIFIFLRVEKKDHWFFLPIITATALSMGVTNYVLKYFFARSRPPLSLGTINVGERLADYSFPSGHATFAWALAFVLAAKQPRLKYVYYLLAFLIFLSRIYLGKHYPADVVAGSLVGLSIGYVSLLFERFVAHYR